MDLQINIPDPESDYQIHVILYGYILWEYFDKEINSHYFYNTEIIKLLK